jgi:hypothetical protein
MSRVLTWAGSEAGTGEISNITPLTTTAITLFSAGYTTTVPTGAEEMAEAVAWRWDFGDGSAYVTSEGPVAGHTYTCTDEDGGSNGGQTPEDNIYTVRVEITDGLGNTTVVSEEVDVSESCFTEPDIIQQYFLPFIGRFFGGQ